MKQSNKEEEEKEADIAMFLKPHAKKVKIANLFIGTLKENSSGDQPPLNSLSKT